MFLNTLIEKAPLVLQKNADKILIGCGIVSGISATVVAIKQTPKATKVLEQYHKAKKDIKDVLELKKNDDSVPYTEADAKEDSKKACIQAVFKLAKIYAPVMILTSLSVTTTLCGYNIANSRYLIANALFMSTKKSFDAYRKNVEHKFGKEVDDEMMSGDFEYTEVKKEIVDGEEKEVVETKKGDKISEQFIRVFDKNTAGSIFSLDPEENKNFLLLWQSHCNDMYNSKGYLLLNDVYDVLGFKKTKQGQIYGWVKDEDNIKNNVTIDFGIFDRKNIQFINGDDPEVVLTFNVTHNVLHSQYFDDVCTDDEKEALDSYFGYINK